MSQLVTVEVVTDELDSPLCPDSYDYNRLPAELRDQAMLAQGTVLTKLGGAVERVIDAGNTLRWAKATLPHGEYLPWVQQACGLKERYAQQLVQAAEWANTQHVAGLDRITDTATLFLLSADATPEEVREWFMERCSAGEPPSRKEVQERKRQAQGKPDRTIEQQALAALKLSPEARELAAQAVHVSTRYLMDALGVEELPKGREHRTAEAVFHKNGTGWWRFPLQPAPAVAFAQEVKVAHAAKVMGYSNTFDLTQRLAPSKIKLRGHPSRNGYTAKPSGRRGYCFLEQITP